MIQIRKNGVRLKPGVIIAISYPNGRAWSFWVFSIRLPWQQCLFDINEDRFRMMKAWLVWIPGKGRPRIYGA